MATTEEQKCKCPFCERVLPLGKEWVDHVLTHVG